MLRISASIPSPHWQVRDKGTKIKYMGKRRRMLMNWGQEDHSIYTDDLQRAPRWEGPPGQYGICGYQLPVSWVSTLPWVVEVVQPLPSSPHYVPLLSHILSSAPTQSDSLMPIGSTRFPYPSSGPQLASGEEVEDCGDEGSDEAAGGEFQQWP